MKKQNELREKIRNSVKKYGDKKGYVLNPNKEMLESVIEGLARNKMKYGKQYCPCRIVTGDSEKDKANICPCVYHKEEIERDGYCHCMLFYAKSNAGEKMRKDSRIPNFHKLDVEDRRNTVKEFAMLSNEDVKSLSSISLENADRMIDNVIGIHPFPLGIATNFLINDKDYLIPMAIEEPSVVAAASNAAKMARVKGGFHAISDEPIMIGQIQLITSSPNRAKCKILNEKERILKIANREDPLLLKLGGGAKDLSARVLFPSTSSSSLGRKGEKGEKGEVIIHLLVNVKDAMGANAVNTMVEAVAPTIEEIGEGKVLLKIISNLATHRLARAYAIFDKDAIGGEEVADRIIMATKFANSDPFRCATHNKGIMNGIDALMIATGNDFRAVESGAHAYASLGGYHSLTTYEKTEDGDLSGSIELPLMCGIIGGATSSSFSNNKVSLKILNVHSAKELACVGASLGLAQNFAALRALVSEGIQRGHMKLHAKNIAAMAGAKGELIDRVAERLIRDGSIRMDRAREILGLEEMQSTTPPLRIGSSKDDK